MRSFIFFCCPHCVFMFSFICSSLTVINLSHSLSDVYWFHSVGFLLQEIHIFHWYKCWYDADFKYTKTPTDRERESFKTINERNVIVLLRFKIVPDTTQKLVYERYHWNTHPRSTHQTIQIVSYFICFAWLSGKSIKISYKNLWRIQAREICSDWTSSSCNDAPSIDETE